ncbi:hypothetical protein [Acinetobacter sp. RF15B]|uniref:hypothetical protein n=1 Tax=Acinetobacter sp. RF15B TaxID=2650966 RepID=UPI0013A598D2|nr:hypothetical protein [Acinetobacter sp. RF15B]
MKVKLLWPMIAATLMSSACSDTSMARKALKPVIEYQCGQELKSSRACPHLALHQINMQAM